ncbi:MAG TPA: hypothetical protein VFC19_18080 [Candidatus Limnocylindrales bacterium]|nr:hypothetical protein [Candidatus Limnocylindrales bacterium]
MSGLRIPVIECGEPLVNLGGQEAVRAVDVVYVRLSLVDRLVTAQTLLPARVKLLVRQGYRANEPAHAAGAAVDLGLCTIDGDPLETGHDWRDLVLALQTVGLVNHPTEPRHWSYGDPYWAFKTGAAAARFGPFTGRRPEPA